MSPSSLNVTTASILTVWESDREKILKQTRKKIYQKFYWGDEHLRPLMGEPPVKNPDGGSTFLIRNRVFSGRGEKSYKKRKQLLKCLRM